MLSSLLYSHRASHILLYPTFLFKVVALSNLLRPPTVQPKAIINQDTTHLMSVFDARAESDNLRMFARSRIGATCDSTIRLLQQRSCCLLAWHTVAYCACSVYRNRPKFTKFLPCSLTLILFECC